MKRNSVKLKSITDCNRFLAKIINQLKNDEIDSVKAGRLGYLLNLLINGLKTGDLERRIEALEELAREREK